MGEILPNIIDVFGPMVGTVVGLFLIPVIVVLWRKNESLQKKNDSDNKEWRSLLLQYTNDSLGFTKSLAKIIEDDVQPKLAFRDKVIDHHNKQEVFRGQVINKLDK